MHWWEEGGNKRHSEGTQEEKWITVRGRVDYRRGGRENPAVERALFLYPANLERLNAVQAVPKQIRKEVIASEKIWTLPWELCERAKMTPLTSASSRICPLR